MSAYRRALQLHPKQWVAHMSLGQLLAVVPGRMAETISHFQAATKILPEGTFMANLPPP
jgi:hypothetical protein